MTRYKEWEFQQEFGDTVCLVPAVAYWSSLFLRVGVGRWEMGFNLESRLHFLWSLFQFISSSQQSYSSWLMSLMHLCFSSHLHNRKSAIKLCHAFIMFSISALCVLAYIANTSNREGWNVSGAEVEHKWQCFLCSAASTKSLFTHLHLLSLIISCNFYSS